MQLPKVVEILSEHTKQKGNGPIYYTTVVKIESKAPINVGDKLEIIR